MIKTFKIAFGILFILVTLPACLYMRISFTPLFGLEFIYWFLFPSFLFVSGVGVLSTKRWAFVTMAAAGIILFSALVDYYVIGFTIGSSEGWQMINLIQYPHPHQTALLLCILCPLLFFALPKVRRHFKMIDKKSGCGEAGKKLDLNKSFVFFFSILIVSSHSAWAQQAPAPIGETPVLPGQQNQQHLLTPLTVCTQIACPPADRCCNACAFQGWAIEGKDMLVQSLEKPFPQCVIDGCGVCPISIRAQGYYDHPTTPSVYFVTQWTQIGQQLPASSPEKPTEDESDSDDTDAETIEEENEKKKEALEEWFKHIQKTNENEIEELETTNPQQQQQQYQKFIDLFQEMSNQGTPQGGSTEGVNY